MALCATSSYYEPQEIAARILPNVVVLTIDPHSDVRSKAFQATSGGDSSEGMGSTISSLLGNASILGWAMNSLTTKGKPSEQTTQAMPPKSMSPLVSVVPTTCKHCCNKHYTRHKHNFNFFYVVVWSTHTQSTTTLVRGGSLDYGGDMADQPAPVSPTSTDDWGELENSIGIHEDEEIEKDGWDDMLPLEDEKLPPALANIEAAQNGLSIPRPKSTSHVSKDAYDDLWGSITAPDPAPAPKLASRSSNLNVKAAAVGGSGSGCVVDEDDPWAAIAAPAPAKGYSYKTSLIVGVADAVKKVYTSV
uniref:Uncharacterized protein n=1 Tax=Lactuca sativa TaxID=4236 RepID=A0A9R1XFI9_LACSA|nr:hypothetical protein LSAT_V11C400177500 [Lactuca sativa]